MKKICLRPGLSAALITLLSLHSALALADIKPLPLSANDAAKLLYQGSFGPTPVMLASTQGQTAEQWLTVQMQLAASWHYPLTRQLCDVAVNADTKAVKAQSNKRQAGNARACLQAQESVWLRHALTAEDQLRQRVAFALSQILVVSSKEAPLQRHGDGLAWYYDLLVKHSFGNYRQLLQEVTLSPAMGVYLSMQGNRKANPRNNTFPDENYAREVMQLFTLGLFQLDSSGRQLLDRDGQAIPSYQQADVEALARVFTGWDLRDNSRYGNRQNGRYDAFMALTPKYHDYQAKQLFGLPIAADLSAEKELTLALDRLFSHPNVGPFISRQLIQRLVSSHPSPAYVARVARVFDDNGRGVKGDLAAVVPAILLDTEARLPVSTPALKLKEPLVRYTGLLRAFNATPKAGDYRLRGMDVIFGQGPLRAESVFNFYQPDYQPQPYPPVQEQAAAEAAVNLVVPEAQIMVDPKVIKQLSLVFKQTMTKHADFDLQLAPLQALANDPEALLEQLDTLLLAGRMSAEFKSQLSRHLVEVKGNQHKLKEAIYLIVSSADYALQP